MRKLKIGTLHRHSFRPLSPVLCLFIFLAKSQTSGLPCFLYSISVFIYFLQTALSASSYHASVLGSRFASTEPQGRVFCAMGVLHTHTHAHFYIHTHGPD